MHRVIRLSKYKYDTIAAISFAESGEDRHVLYRRTRGDEETRARSTPRINERRNDYGMQMEIGEYRNA